METLITKLVQAFEVSEPLAIVIALLVVGCGASVVLLTGIVVRLNMHASHFDVNDKNIDRSKEDAKEAQRQAHSATRDAAYAKGYVMGYEKGVAKKSPD